MSRSNDRGRRRDSGRRGLLWLATILLPWLTACATSSGASKAESTPLRTGKIVAVGPLADLQPTRPDRCARPTAKFVAQSGFVVMYRSQVGYRTRVVALNGEQRARVGDTVSVDANSCDAVVLSNAAA
jgi:hypothetical protein